MTLAYFFVILSNHSKLAVGCWLHNIITSSFKKSYKNCSLLYKRLLETKLKEATNLSNPKCIRYSTLSSIHLFIWLWKKVKKKLEKWKWRNKVVKKEKNSVGHGGKNRNKHMMICQNVIQSKNLSPQLKSSLKSFL